MEVNPYEPPHEPEPLSKKPPLKRAIGVGVILLLTPVAVIIAGGASCAAAIAIVDSFSFESEFFGEAVVLAWIVSLGLPVLTLIAMIWWAIRASQRPRE